MPPPTPAALRLAPRTAAGGVQRACLRTHCIARAALVPRVLSPSGVARRQRRGNAIIVAAAAPGGSGEAYAIPWYATTPARTLGLAGMLKVFLFTLPHTTFPVLMLAGGKAMPVGAAQSAVALVGGAALAAVAARLDGTDFLIRARRGMWALIAGCVALAALASYVTPVDVDLAREMLGRRGGGRPASAQPAPGPVRASPAPLAPRRTVLESDAEFARLFGVEAGVGKGGGRAVGRSGGGRAGGGPLLF